MDWADTTARWNKNHLSFGIWCVLYKRFYGNAVLWALGCIPWHEIMGRFHEGFIYKAPDRNILQILLAVIMILIYIQVTILHVMSMTCAKLWHEWIFLLSKSNRNCYKDLDYESINSMWNGSLWGLFHKSFGNNLSKSFDNSISKRNVNGITMMKYVIV